MQPLLVMKAGPKSVEGFFSTGQLHNYATVSDVRSGGSVIYIYKKKKKYHAYNTDRNNCLHIAIAITLSSNCADALHPPPFRSSCKEEL